jgi:hypothetical protein
MKSAAASAAAESTGIEQKGQAATDVLIVFAQFGHAKILGSIAGVMLRLFGIFVMQRTTTAVAQVCGCTKRAQFSQRQPVATTRDENPSESQNPHPAAKSAARACPEQAKRRRDGASALEKLSPTNQKYRNPHPVLAKNARTRVWATNFHSLLSAPGRKRS